MTLSRIAKSDSRKTWRVLPFIRIRACPLVDACATCGKTEGKA
jgi:hypothetical protein